MNNYEPTQYELYFYEVPSRFLRILHLRGFAQFEKKESKWNKFWEAVGWVLYEHGDEIFAAAVDAYWLQFGNFSRHFNTSST